MILGRNRFNDGWQERIMQTAAFSRHEHIEKALKKV